MRNKKGFTLIELLAIIVILAVIMVIAVPQILNVVNGSKNGAWKNNVNMIERAITKNSKLVDPETGFYKYTIDGLCSNTSKFKEIVKADDTSITCSNNVFTLTGAGQFTGKSATITCINNKCSVSINDSNQVELAAGLYDSSNNLIASWDSLVNDYGMDIWAMYNNWYRNDGTIKRYQYMNQSRYNLEAIYNSDGMQDYNITSATWFFMMSDYDEHGAGGTSISVNDVEINSPAVVFHKNQELFSGTRLVIPGSVRVIPAYAFAYCINLEEVVIQEGVTQIQEGAFCDDSALRKVEFENGIKRIGRGAFAGDLNLQYINIPSTVEYLANEFLIDSMYQQLWPTNLNIYFSNSNGWEAGYIDTYSMYGEDGDDYPNLDGSLVMPGSDYDSETGEITPPIEVDSNILSSSTRAANYFLSENSGYDHVHIKD